MACGDPAPSSVGAPSDAEVTAPRVETPRVIPDTSVAPKATRPRGLWVLAEGSQRVLEDPARVERLLADATALGATDLFVQVYRGGRAWFDSSWADAGPYRKTRETWGRDTLAELIEGARARGMAVHAWVNVLSLSSNLDPPILRELGRGAVLVDRQGRSLLDYPKLEVPEPDRRYYRMGTRGVYLDPAAPGVADHLAQTFAELLTRYPGLAGLHLDYIRYPDVLPFIPGSRFGVGHEFGYGAPAIARFKRETGLDAPGPNGAPNANRWDQWRREKVTEVVARIRERAREAHPTVALSAAVASHVDRAYLSLYQDWQRWLEDGLLEFAVAMVYTLDDRMFRYQVQFFAGAPLGPRIWLGQGTWLFARRPQGALDQIRTARTAGGAGEVLFSYDSIVDAPPLLAALRDGLDAPVPRAAPVASADPAVRDDRD